MSRYRVTIVLRSDVYYKADVEAKNQGEAKTKACADTSLWEFDEVGPEYGEPKVFDIEKIDE